MTKDEIIIAQQARIEQLVSAIVQFRNEPCLGRMSNARATDGYLAMERAAIDTNDDLSALRAHDEKLLAPYQWQPIETAPKGGRFLTCTKLSDGSFGQAGISHSFFCHSVNVRDWRIAGDDPHATHWIPLPSTEAIEKDDK